MSSDHYECSVNSVTNIGKREEELLAPRNHFDVINDIIKREIKEEPVETKWLFENGVCDKSRQEEEQDRKFNEPVPSNCGKNPEELKHSLTHFWENTNFDTKGSEYISAADIEQIKKEIKVENVNEDTSESPDDFSTTNAKLKKQILKTEDEIDIVFEDIKPEIHRDKLSGNKCSPNTIANIVPHESSIDFGAGPQQNTTVEEDETDIERDNQKQFQCNFCSNTFFKSSDLSIHERTHIGEKPFQGNFCSKSLIRSSNLKNLGTCTREKIYQCNFCLKSFPKSSNWKDHERIHTGEKPFQCNFCLKSFSQSSTLKNHMRIHSEEKPFQCNFCSKSFSNNRHLKIHERIHTGEKPFQCNFCLKSFSQSSTLKNHMRIHTGEKPFQCNFCSGSFSNNRHLKIHERTHTGETPFQCNFCSKSFTRSSTLKNHEKNHTGKGPF